MMKLRSVANSRFVFIQVKGPPLNWQGVLGGVDNFILSRTKFERANSFGIIYGLRDDTYWIGREVIGPRSILNESEYQILDFKSGSVYFEKLPLDENLSWSEMEKIKTGLTLKLLEQNIHSSWRIRIDLAPEKEISLEIQFFHKSYDFPKIDRLGGPKAF